MTVPALEARVAPLSISDSLLEIRSAVSVFFSDELMPPGACILQGSTAGAEGELLSEVYVIPYGN